MFGSGKKQELENQVKNLKERLDREQQEKAELQQQLKAAQEKAAGLEQKMAELEESMRDVDYEQLKEQARTTVAEYEGLKQLYTGKVQAFESAKEEEEQQFARESARKRYDLDNEIRDNRQANQDYVAQTVQTFSESYNYYLDQIRVLMDALKDVAASTGSTLFAQPNGDLKASFGRQMVEKLKSGADALRSDTGDRMLIGSAEEPVEEAAEAVAEEAEAAEEAVEALDETVDEAAETVEETAEEVAEVAEAAEEAVEAVEEVVE